MEVGLSLVLLIVIILVFVSNPKNTVNRWCGVAGLLFWLGVAKEAVAFYIIPNVESAFGYTGLLEGFMPVYSVATWALYSLAMPTAVIFAHHFCDFGDHLKKFTFLLYIPVLILSFFFPPLQFREFQLESHTFWIIYTIHNLVLCVVFTYYMIIGVRLEQPGRLRTQKKWVALVLVPPVLFWNMTIFIFHTLQLERLYNVWRFNIIIILAGAVIIILVAYRDGFMGLKLSGEKYDWNDNMGLVKLGAEHTGHMIKNQTTKMEICVDQLKTYFPKDKTPEELEILSRSILTLKNFTAKKNRHSQTIVLSESQCRLTDLFSEALPTAIIESKDITIINKIDDNVSLICDEKHMIEVFSNIITNAVEAIHEHGTIEITGNSNKFNYVLTIKDDGAGLERNLLKNIFKPYFTTKSTGNNFGLGLAYSKNVILKHGGDIFARSRPESGTTITITFPPNRVIIEGTENQTFLERGRNVWRRV